MKPTYRKSWAWNRLMCSDLTLAPPSWSNDGLLALVSCLSSGYNLHWFSELSFVLFSFSFFFCVSCVFILYNLINIEI